MPERRASASPRTAAGCRRHPRGHPRGGHPPLRHRGVPARRGPRDRRRRRGDRRAGQPLLRLQGEALRRGDRARPGHRGTCSRASGETWPTTSPGSWCTGRRTHRTGWYTPLLLLLHSATEPRAVKLFRRDLNRTAIPLLAEQIGGEDAAVRAAMVDGTAHGVRDHAPRAPPQGVRGRPWRRAGGPPVQEPRRLYRLKLFGGRSVLNPEHPRFRHMIVNL